LNLPGPSDTVTRFGPALLLTFHKELGQVQIRMTSSRPDCLESRSSEGRIDDAPWPLSADRTAWAGVLRQARQPFFCNGPGAGLDPLAGCFRAPRNASSPRHAGDTKLREGTRPRRRGGPAPPPEAVSNWFFAGRVCNEGKPHG
jgi:hypothetical protein